jgi:nucleoside phosphorylase
VTIDRPPLHEDYELSCSVLVDRVRRTGGRDPAIRRMLVDDFISKAMVLPEQTIAQLATNMLVALASPVGNILAPLLPKAAVAPRRPVDLAIITIIREELDSTMLALGIDLQAPENYRVHGLRCWETPIVSNSGQELKVVVTMVGEARNVACANACNRIFHAYRVRNSILVGIAAGVRDKVTLGDVVTADLVIDYEGARLEPEGPRKRIVTYPLEHLVARDLGYFVPGRAHWQEHLQACLQKLMEVASVPDLPANWKPAFHRGVIAAGEKLLADGSLPGLRDQYDERIRAGEMEGSGFVAACREHSIPWLVFRGISDYGDPEKRTSEKWRHLAALSAATAAVAFVKSEFPRRDDVEP